MLERPLTIVNALGLHARAASQLVRLANRHRCRITIERTDIGLKANAKSILSVLHLAAGNGTSIFVVADGDDEVEAIAAIEGLFASGFGEL